MRGGLSVDKSFGDVADCDWKPLLVCWLSKVYCLDFMKVWATMLGFYQNANVLIPARSVPMCFGTVRLLVAHKLSLTASSCTT